MSLPKAYCKEAGRVVDIFEAHDLYFAQKEPRKRFDFRCPDDDCRNAMNPVVIGVNYDKNPDENEFVQRPHFRLKKGTVHSDDCPWAEIVAAMEELDDEDGCGHLTHLKKSEIVNVFKPLADGEDGEPSAADIDAGFLARLRSIKDRRDRINALKEHLRGALNSTSRLHEVVRCFMAMSDDERRAQNLTIPPYGPKSYRGWFRFAKYCRKSDVPLIYYGGANVKKYHSGYSLKFWVKAEQQDGTTCSVYAFISNDRIENFRGGKMLAEIFEGAIEIQEQNRHRYPVDLFVFGTPERSEDGKRLDIAFDSLHSVVVMPTDRGA